MGIGLTMLLNGIIGPRAGGAGLVMALGLYVILKQFHQEN